MWYINNCLSFSYGGWTYDILKVFAYISEIEVPEDATAANSFGLPAQSLDEIFRNLTKQAKKFKQSSSKKSKISFKNGSKKSTKAAVVANGTDAVVENEVEMNNVALSNNKDGDCSQMMNKVSSK